MYDILFISNKDRHGEFTYEKFINESVLKMFSFQPLQIKIMMAVAIVVMNTTTTVMITIKNRQPLIETSL
jgi:hypothetical protein